MTSFKICRICLKFPPAVGGLENHVYELSNEQSLMDYEVHIIMPYFATIIVDSFKMHIIKVTRIEPTSDKSNLRKILILLKILIFECLTIPLLLKLDSKHDFNIVHVHGDWFMAILGGFIRLLLKKPVVLTIHASMKGGLWSKLGRIGVKPFLIIDKIITVSEEIREQLIEAGVPSSKIYVISSGVRLSQFYRVKKSYIKKDNPIILFVGRIRRMKGIDILIKAFRLVLEVFPNARLLVIGDGPSRAELEELSLQMSLEEHINFLGMVPHHRIPKYLSLSDVFILPSIETSKEGEGRPTALIEAMAAGMPIVASNIYGIPEIIRNGENGLLTNQGAFIQLAENIIRLLSDPILAASLGKNAADTAIEFDWKTIAEKVSMVYQMDQSISSARIAKEYDACAESYFMHIGSKEEQDFVNRTIIEFIKIKPEAKVLDVGCASGVWLEYILKRVKSKNKLKLYGIDLSKEQIILAKKRLNIKNLIVGDFLTYSFSEFFDVIFFIRVFHFFTKKEERIQVFQKISRLLNPGGVVVIIDCERYHLHTVRIWISLRRGAVPPDYSLIRYPSFRELRKIGEISNLSFISLYKKKVFRCLVMKK